MSRIQADLLLLSCAVVWGTAFVFQKTAMAHLGPLAFIMARAGVAALVLVPLAVWELRQRAASAQGDGAPRPLTLAAGAAFAGTLFFLGAALQQIGIVSTSVTNAGFFTALYVVLVPLLAWVVRGAAPTRLVWVAVGASIAGAWAMSGGSLTALTHGDGLVILSALFWAAHVLSLNLAAARALPILFTTLQFACVAALGLAGALPAGGVSLAAIAAAAPEIAYVGILSSAATFTLLIVAMRHTSPAEAAVIVSSETAFAAIAGYLWLDERLDALGWLGAGLIMAATLAVALGGRQARAARVGAEPAAG